MSIAVLYGCDDNYAPYTGISMLSLFENNKDANEIVVYLAGINISAKNLARISEIASKYNRKLVLLDTQKAVERMMQYNCGKWNGSIATWLRFFVLEQIPEGVPKLIWLDSDTLVYSALSDLVNIDIGSAPVAAVCDCLSYWQRLRLGIDVHSSYYNAGVILFNLSIWREQDILSNMMSYLEKNVERYAFQDQDLLNDFFREKIYRLPSRYNLQCFLMAYSIDDYFAVYPWEDKAYYTAEELLSSLENPSVVHFFRFLGDYPWTKGNNYHPAKALYEKWKQQSPWRDSQGARERKELSFRIEKILYRILPRQLFLRIFAVYTNREYLKKTARK